MDLMPPLIQSHACTPKTYCRSESSITDCPSPDLVGQHYSISSVYDLGLPCSMASPYDPGASLSRLGQDVQPEWKWHPAVVLHPSLTRASVPSNINAEYDPFSSYDGTFSGLCPSEIQAARSHYTSPAALPASRSPGPSSSSKNTMVYPPIGTESSSTTSRLQRDHADPGYSHNMEGSQYPSPSIAHAPYPPTMNNNPSLPSQIRHTAGPSSSSCIINDSVTYWQKTDRFVTESDQVHTDTGSHSPGLLPMAHDARHAAQVSTRPRRAPRKLTTKEDANFECSVTGCGKLFSRSYNFKAHMETHREKREYPFPCQVQGCTKKFVRKTDLRRHHQSVHMKERNYKCEYCGRGFSRRDTLGR